MSRTILITVRLHEGRFHGTGDEPPSPARLFQALVAGVGVAGPLSAHDSDALEWLERCDPPIIASPRMTNGQVVTTYVPNNDLDAVGGDPGRIGEIRTQKVIRPNLFDADVPFIYAWAFSDDGESNRHAQQVCSLADRLYQFGRGVDLAWAWGEVLDNEQAEARLSSFPGRVRRPSDRGCGAPLACPRPGSLHSLKARYAASSQRFKSVRQGRAAKQLFTQPPKPLFVRIAYDSPPTRRVYELRLGNGENSFGAWPLARVSQLVVLLRDGAVQRLRQALPEQSSMIERVVVGRKAHGADDGPTSARVKIVPLPSIGHQHADREIRRVMVEVPPGCPLRPDDVQWAFSGLELVVPGIEARESLVATPSTDESIYVHYGIGDVKSSVWRTLTPVALPESAGRRRIDPGPAAADAKNGAERTSERARAAGATVNAVRLAETRARADLIRVQREPFEAKGERVEAFASGTRFPKERLWHVEITFAEPITGPLIIGDGRFLGLGIMVPVESKPTRELA
jgi:CRISPR-associated protein Csb2